MRILTLRRAAFLAALVACCLAAGVSSFAQSVRLIVDPVDETQRVVLRGNTRPEVTAANDQGPVADSLPLNGIEIQLKMSPAQEQAAETLADDLQRAGSSQFHQWLTAEQYADQFGVAPEDITAISDWLTRHGFTVDDTGPMTIMFSGTAGQVREAFGTEIHKLEVKGEQHIANASDPSIPAALAPAVEGIVSLHDFRPRSMISHKPKAQYTFPGVNPPFYAVVPADLATIYDFKPLFAAGTTGRGQTIAIIQDSDLYNPDDWKAFRQEFGLDVYKGASLETIHPGKSCADPGINVNGDFDEAALDVEWASAAAPSAQIQLVACSDTATTSGLLIAVQNLLNQRRTPPIMSTSFLDCEVQNGAAGNAVYRVTYQQAVLEGVSEFIAAGDSGAAACDDHFSPTPAQSGMAVNALASTEYNVAVGGTDFGDYYAGTTANYWSPTNNTNYGSVRSYVPEIPWNETCASGLITSYLGYATPYGADGFCASAFGQFFLYPVAGSGGPSNCATGESDLGSPPNPVVGLPVPSPSDGSCRGWKKPDWQHVFGNPNDGVRDLPDVSLFAGAGTWDHAYVYCDSAPLTVNGPPLPCTAMSNWFLNGGTSFASPIMAGIQALVNQAWGSRQGNPDPVYYALANLEYGKNGNRNCDNFATGGPAPVCVFHDITIGDTAVDCVAPYNCYAPGGAGAVGVLSLSDHHYEPAFKAGVGWDFATGLGSVNAKNLVLNPIWREGVGP